MFSHVVLFKLQAPEHREPVAQRLRSLFGVVPTLRALEVGLDEGADPRACDVCLITRFDDVAGLDAYRVHPAHQEVLAYLRTVVVSAAVVDWTG